MRRHLDRPTTSAAAVRPQVARGLLLALTLIALAAAIAAFAFVRIATSRHAAARQATSAFVASADHPSTPWFLPEPTPLKVGQATNQPARTKAAAHEPDWSALSLGVSDAQAAPVAANVGIDAGSPIELKVAMSGLERDRLIAAAREADSGPAPAGYRPAIGALYPAGSGDGTCK
jgi:hypothetical protein